MKRLLHGGATPGEVKAQVERNLEYDKLPKLDKGWKRPVAGSPNPSDVFNKS